MKRLTKDQIELKAIREAWEGQRKTVEALMKEKDFLVAHPQIKILHNIPRRTIRRVVEEYYSDGTVSKTDITYNPNTDYPSPSDFYGAQAEVTTLHNKRI